MRPIDADKLKPDYMVPSTTTGTPCHWYISKEQIDLAPTIEAEPVRRGRWKRTTAYPNIIICDKCAEPFEKSNSNDKWNYCPNCGAYMRKEATK